MTTAAPASTITTTTGEPLLTEGPVDQPTAPELTDDQLVDLVVIRGLDERVTAQATDEQLVAVLHTRGYVLTSDAAEPINTATDAELLTELNLRETTLPEVADLGRPCPFCQVTAGRYCRTSSGAPTLSHAARRDRAPVA